MSTLPVTARISSIVVAGFLLLACTRGAGGRAGTGGEPVLEAAGDPIFRGAEQGKISSLQDPPMGSVSEADAFMLDEEPVVGIAPPGGQPRAYSAWHLDSHEVVNDSLPGGPLLVTW